MPCGGPPTGRRPRGGAVSTRSRSPLAEGRRADRPARPTTRIERTVTRCVRWRAGCKRRECRRRGARARVRAIPGAAGSKTTCGRAERTAAVTVSGLWTSPRKSPPSSPPPASSTAMGLSALARRTRRPGHLAGAAKSQPRALKPVCLVIRTRARAGSSARPPPAPFDLCHRPLVLRHRPYVEPVVL